MDADKIKEIRMKLGLSQESFAHLVGVTLSTIARWEKGLFNPSKLALDKIKTLMMKEKNEGN